MMLGDIDAMTSAKAEYIKAKRDLDRVKEGKVDTVIVSGERHSEDVLCSKLHSVVLAHMQERHDYFKTKLMQYGVTEFP